MCSWSPGKGFRFSTLPLKQLEIPGPGSPLALICKKVWPAETALRKTSLLCMLGHQAYWSLTEEPTVFSYHHASFSRCLYRPDPKMAMRIKQKSNPSMFYQETRNPSLVFTISCAQMSYSNPISFITWWLPLSHPSDVFLRADVHPPLTSSVFVKCHLPWACHYSKALLQILPHLILVTPLLTGQFADQNVVTKHKQLAAKSCSHPLWRHSYLCPVLSWFSK